MKRFVMVWLFFAEGWIFGRFLAWWWALAWVGIFGLLAVGVQVGRRER